MDSAHRPIDARGLDIDLETKAEAELFRWLLACLLFGKPIQQGIARRAYELLIAAGMTSLGKLAAADWNELVHLLDEAHYVRYDVSTATKLKSVAQAIKIQYSSVTQLLKQCADARELQDRLTAFRGIGPVTASIFIASIAPVWFAPTGTAGFALARRAVRELNKHGFEAYIIGGAVRDLWLGKSPKDFDLVTSATPAEIMRIPAFRRSRYKDTAQAYGVTRVRLPYRRELHELEMATFRKDLDAHLGRKATKVAFAELEDDVQRRDFTINALALDPSTNFVTDYAGGIADLEQRVVRFIGEPEDRIREDPVRLMRAIRFKNQLGFTYAPQTEQAIARAVSDGCAETIAVDRLRAELTAMLLHPSRRSSIEDLDRLGILQRVLPEVTAGKRVAQPPAYHAEGSVWQHELLVLTELPPAPSRRLAWAALLHDIGKAPTKRRDIDGRIHFNRHHAVGAELAKTALRRLNFSNRDVQDICWIIYHHLAIDDLPRMRPSHQRAMLRHPAFLDLYALHQADAAASLPASKRRSRPTFPEIDRIWRTYIAKPPAIRHPSLKQDVGLDGNWLLATYGEEYGITPGPIVGRVLRQLEARYQDTGETDVRTYSTMARRLLGRWRRRGTAQR